VLAGGAGSRLGGCAKGLIEIDGRTALARLLDLVPLVSRVLLGASDSSPYAHFGLEQVADVFPGGGAPGGVVSLLLRTRTPWLLAVGCDMPFFDLNTGRALVAAASQRDHEVIVAARSGRLEPLAALYRAELGPRWLPQLERGPSLQALIRSARFEAVEVPAASALDSLNTFDDLRRLRGRLPATR
jgi:molybdopterin-guanine dinucleotide biosynthesis protein A